MSVGTSRNVSARFGAARDQRVGCRPAGLRRAVKRELQDGRGVVGRQVPSAVAAAGEVVRAGPQQHMPFVPFMIAGVFLIVPAGTTK